MSNIGPLELIIIAIVIIVLFGGNKLPDLARGISKASEEFRKGLKEEDSDSNGASSKHKKSS